MSTLQIADLWTFWATNMSTTIFLKKKRIIFHYFIIPCWSDYLGGCWWGSFCAVCMLEYKGKRNSSLERLQDVNVAIISLNPHLGSQSCNSNQTMQGKKNTRDFFSNLMAQSVCHLVGQIYAKHGVFLNLKINIFPLKDSCFQIPSTTAQIPVCTKCW